MQLLELTQAEVAFLIAPAVPADTLQAALTRKLAATLTARLRQPVQLVLHPSGVSADVSALPVWQPDAALATLWLTRRLGGQRVSGTASFIPPSLLQTLDATLAECWLDQSWPAMPLAGLAWTIRSGLTQARLAVQWPPTTTDMTRWARGVIQHG